MPRKTEWFNDESFWQYFAPIMFNHKRWAEAPAVLDAVTHLAKLDLYRAEPDLTAKAPRNIANKRSSPPELIDLCCGPGRITLAAARAGWNVTGVDITQSYLETAQSDAKHENLSIEFLLQDVRDLDMQNKFDAAINLYNSFGYFESDDDNFLFLQNAYNCLKQGGVFIMEALGKEIAVRDFIEDEWFPHSGWTVLTEYKPLDSWTKMQNHWILINETEAQDGCVRIERCFTQRLYAASELRGLFFKAGFADVDIFGAWDESPYDQHAETLIVVGRKS